MNGGNDLRFEKVSFEQWKNDITVKGVDDNTLRRWYENIKLPQQGSEFSMGVDFFMPYPIHLLPHNEMKVATGIRWICDDSADTMMGMMIFPRSGLGSKYGMRLKTTVGIIDSDYWTAPNEGEIYLIFENPSDEEIELPAGKAIAQGIITTYYIPSGAESNKPRVGGLGSSDKTEGHV